MTGSDPTLLRAAYVESLVAGDPRGSRSVVDRLIAIGVAARSICLDTLAPALVHVGDLWQAGQLTVAEEHLATAITSANLVHLLPYLDEPPPIGRRVVLSATPGEIHVVGLQMVGDFLEGDGWEVLYLGASTPADALVDLVRSTRPDVVGLSTSLTTHLRDTQATIALLHALPEPSRVIVGGAAYAGDASLAASLGADDFASDAGSASDLLRRFAGLG